MPRVSCSVCIREDEAAATLRVTGRVTMNQCPTVRRWADQCLSSATPQLRIDLSRCTYMDSTFVGTLLALYRRSKERGLGTLALLDPSPACRQVLRQMHLLEIFTVVDQPDSSESGWSEMPLDEEEKTTLLRQVVSAHEELAALPGEVGDSFRDIAQELSSELPSSNPS